MPPLASAPSAPPTAAEAIRGLRARYVSGAIGHATSLVVDHALGAEVWDVDGRRCLDFAAGIGTLNVGHAHPRIVQAIQRQAARLTHVAFGVAMYAPYVRLAQVLAELIPGSVDAKALFANSGAEAIENAIKIARAATGRSLVVAFTNAFHGRTLLAMALTAKDHSYKTDFGPFPNEILRAPQPYPYRPAFPVDEVAGCLAVLERLLDEHRGQVAGIVFEPVQGEGGFVPAPAEWVRGVRQLASHHGVVLIADEVQTGFGRTARWFAVEHADIVPDLLVCAKSLAGGLPLSAVIGRAELMDAAVVGGLGGTFGGNPVACAAALAVVEVIRSEGLVARAEHIGERALGRLTDLAAQFDIVGDVRGLGAMVAMELVRDRHTREPADRETAEVITLAAERGLILIRAGLHDNVVRLLPPLVTSHEQLDEGLDVLHQCLADIARRST